MPSNKSPLLFSLASWSLIDEIESRLTNFSQHDGIIAGTETALCRAFEILTESRKNAVWNSESIISICGESKLSRKVTV